jgi:Uma2 family endonuclease
MSVGLTHSDVLQKHRRVTVDEYHRMIEAGSLGEDDRVQLVDGAVVAMTPQGPAHALAIQNLTRLLIPEYWIVNLAEATVEVHRDPDSGAGAYRTKTVVASDGALAASSVPGVRIVVADLFR